MREKEEEWRGPRKSQKGGCPKSLRISPSALADSAPRELVPLLPLRASKIELVLPFDATVIGGEDDEACPLPGEEADGQPFETLGSARKVDDSSITFCEIARHPDPTSCAA